MIVPIETLFGICYSISVAEIEYIDNWKGENHMTILMAAIVVAYLTIFALEVL